jgi:hypothetical protein
MSNNHILFQWFTVTYMSQIHDLLNSSNIERYTEYVQNTASAKDTFLNKGLSIDIFLCLSLMICVKEHS